MNLINSLRGTCDILPDEIKYWNFIEEKIKNILLNANYTEIRTPLLEMKELFDRGVGQGTDIVNKEMYSFKDQGNREITLRPEGTAGIIRCIIENKLYIQKPIQKLWYLGPMFRYERPQNGRQRQFNQLGIEYIGSQDARADTEVINLAYQLLNQLEVPEFTLQLNSIGSLEDRSKYKKNLVQYLKRYYLDLDEDSKIRLNINPLRILDTKEEKTQELLKNAPQLCNFLGENSKRHFEHLCIYLNSLQIPFKVNQQLVRGLDYYNDTAFEFKTEYLGSQDTICGGGRYDKLSETLGGPYIPAIGWAIGIERLLLLVKQKVLLSEARLDFYIVSENSVRCKIESIVLLNEIINKGFKAELDTTDASLRKKISRSYKFYSTHCIIIGEKEITTNKVTIKELQNNMQFTITREKFMKLYCTKTCQAINTLVTAKNQI
uniref:histidine--tRNA ligase n=1 Tax=Rhodochaete parvula TaxID=110510 RepID=A0A1X9PUV3_9RHOD|nr:histidine tRNA synthetase [Rhodochaete parvula]ASK39636.1 histidine-tRNA synthetase [Rhodochaete parvula]